MTSKTKIIIGVGAVALIYFFFINGKSKSTPNKKSTKTKSDNDNKYQVLENFNVDYFNSITNKSTNAYFRKGQIVYAKPIPMGVGVLVSTPEGKYPNDSDNKPTVRLPKSKLKKV